MRSFLIAVICLGIGSGLHAQEGKADKYQGTIDKGLAWLIKQQAKDGSWAANGGTYTTSTTALAGMVLLADGNTLEEGKHRDNLKRALDWFLKQKSKEKRYAGVLGDVDNPGNVGRYLVQHGVAMSFLARIYGEIPDKKVRAPVLQRLKDAVAFAVEAQTSRGAWFYTSKIDGHDSEENVATMLVLQGLFDARDAGIAVPRETLDKASKHLRACTTKEGGIRYAGHVDPKDPQGGGRPIITAMALAAYLPRQNRDKETTKRWLAFCATQPLMPSERMPGDQLLVHFYFSRAVFHLEEREWKAAFPDKAMPDHLTWKKYRTALFDRLQREQGKDGSWNQGWSLGPVFNTSVALNIFLYEKSAPLPLSR